MAVNFLINPSQLPPEHPNSVFIDCAPFDYHELSGCNHLCASIALALGIIKFIDGPVGLDQLDDYAHRCTFKTKEIRVTLFNCNHIKTYEDGNVYLEFIKALSQLSTIA